MQSYHAPRYTGKPDPEFDAYADECNNRNLGYQSTWGQPVAPQQPCGNPMCSKESEAVFCSDYCRVMIEGDEDADGLYEGFYVSQADERPLWQVVADPATYNGTAGRELVRGR